MIEISFMKVRLTLFWLLLSTCVVQSQTPISGAINNEAGIAVVDYCNNAVVVNNPAGFSAGDLVLLIQMQGATVVFPNTSNYGNIIGYANSGNYELLTIRSVVGTTITFDQEIERNYTASGKVQLVRVPNYSTAVVSGNLSAPAWNGSEGGILAIKADTLILNDTITVSGIGFRGAFGNDSLNSGDPGGNPSGYEYATVIYGAPKGEAIAVPNNLYGRGKIANGGGGGNNHNAGGGGGGNFGSGGIGGQTVNNVFSYQGQYPGIGGAALSYVISDKKIFMGGGGGCGHGNNWSTPYGFDNTGGTNGGGICLIIANVLIGNGQTILARGLDQTRVAHGDGAGAGGAGGTVFLHVNQYQGTINVDASGGKGGNVDNGNFAGYQKCFGPGGGGGGGVLVYNLPSLPANVNFVANGGASGITTFTNSACGYGYTGGAQPGAAGGTLPSVSLTQGTKIYQKLQATFPNDTVICSGRNVTLTAQGTSSDTVAYQWSSGSQNNTITVAPGSTTPYTISVFDGNSCTVSKTINITVQNVIPNYSNDTLLCTSGPVTLHADNTTSTPVNYLWSNSATTPSISVTPTTSASYSVTVSANGANGCSVTHTFQITVGALSVNFSNDTAICRGQSVNLYAQPTTAGTFQYSWSTGENTATISLTPTITKTYVVTVTETGSNCTAAKGILVQLDTILIQTTPDTTICPNTSATLSATLVGTGTASFLWNTGATTASISVSPAVNSSYVVDASTAQGCRTADTIHVLIDTFFNSLRASKDTVICPGSTARLLALAPTATGYSWSSGSTGGITSVQPAQSAIYTVTATNVRGCTATASVAVTVADTATHLQPVITASPGISVELGQSIQLEVLPANGLKYAWNPGTNLSDSTIHNPIVTPQNIQTIYCVWITDSSLCKAVICDTIYVIITEPKLELPTAFTPNGDGKNDVLRAAASSEAAVDQIKIYNRQGALYYQGDNSGWDGTFLGTPAPAGLYTMMVAYHNAASPEKRFNKMGEVLLIR
ncbi:MAG: gliding motility-associated C-terminal domain-containing protein [Chitinophagales bacterium]